MNTEYIPLPDSLPPLPEAPEGHWWAYRGFAWNPKRPAVYAYLDDCCNQETATWIYNEVKEIPMASRGYYAELVPIDYADPAYRAYVEYMHRKGKKIQIRYKSSDLPWIESHNPYFIWRDADYRVAPDQPKEPDYFSEEYQAELFRKWIATDSLQRESWYPVEGQWEHTSTPYIWNKSIYYREPKPELVEVPLDDIKVSECITRGREWGLACVERIDGEGMVDLGYGWIEPLTLFKEGAQIHRNGKWVPCSRKVEKK